MEKEKTTNQGKSGSSVFSPGADKVESKLHFVWDECQPPRMDAGQVWAKTAEKIREHEEQEAARRSRNRRRLFLRGLWGAAAMVALLLGGYVFRQWQPGEALPSSIGPCMENSVCLEGGDGVRLVMLADSSRMWVNEGSRVVYPRAFAQERREIFVEGEVYLEVTRDEARPFVVHTDAFAVEVLGTSFDVKAYEDAPGAVVLVEGSVRVEDAQRQSVIMQPDERLEVDEAGIGTKEKVDAQAYIRWVHKVWVLEGKPLREVLQDLGAYYGVEIGCDAAVAGEPFYGKLFLDGDVRQVLEAIRLTLPGEAGKDDGAIYIK